MEDFILKNFDSEVKTVEGERALNVTITTRDVDRSGDIVEPKGARLVNFKKNPVVLMAHDYHGLPIGKASNLEKTDNGIIAKVTFPEEGVYPLSDTVYNMYKQKFMRAWSIGFMPIKSEDIVDDEKGDKIGRGRRFKTWELIEFSACPVPNNPNALTNMIEKGIDVDTLKEAGFIDIVKDTEKTKYNCECIECGHKIKSDKHCKEIKCPKCGGTMRRVERPGPGEEINMEENVITKPKETEKFIRIPVKGEEGKHKGHRIRTITIDSKQGITALYCGECKKVITFIFAKAKGWTMAKAKKWVEDHEKTIEDYIEKVDWDVFKEEDLGEIEWDKVKADIEKEVKDESSIDEDEKDLDINALINRICEINIENKDLKEKIKDIELKAGAVLNAKNKKDLKQAQTLIQSVLDSATTGEEEDSLEITEEKEKDDKTDNIVIDLVTDTVDDPPIDEEKDEDKIEVDEKVIAETINKHMNYLVGKLDKSDT